MHGKRLGMAVALGTALLSLWSLSYQADCRAARAIPEDQQATQKLEVPALAPCQVDAVPKLPRKWTAIGLLAPFTDDQLVVGQFSCDTTIPAMRATLYGVDRGRL